MTVFLLLVATGLLTLVSSQCCEKFAGWKCEQCPKGTHIYRGHCLFNIPNCLSYIDGFDCGSCETNYELKNGECEKIDVKDQIVEEILDLQNLGEREEEFDIAHDLFRSLHPQVRNAQVGGAKYISIPNKENNIVIEYLINGKVYQGILEINMATSIFKELSFKEIPKQTIVNEQNDVKIIRESPISPQQYQTQIEGLTNLARSANGRVKDAIGGKVVEYDDGSKIIIIIFSSTNAGNFKVKGKVELQKNIKLVSIEGTNKTGMEEQYGNLADSFVNKPLNTLSSDPNYKLVEDFIKRQLDGYSGLSPYKVGSFKKDDIIYYELFFRKQDSSEWRITANINIKSSIIVIEKEENIKEGRNEQPKQEKMDLNLIFKDINFIQVREGISKQLNQKYQQANISSVYRLDQSQLVTYTIVFLFSDSSEWETVASISKINSNVNIISDNQIGGPPPPDNDDFDTKTHSPIILNRVQGYTRLKKETIEQNQTVQSILNLLLINNEKELKNADLEAVYEQQQPGFNFSYKIFYLNGDNLYEAQVSHSLLFRRTFVSSFNAIRF